MRSLLCAVALVACAAQAYAQGTEAEPQAAPGSLAIGMIEQADAEGVFELVHDGQVTVRHVGSGMICHFLRSGDGGRLILYPGLPRGDNVACDFNDGREFFTIYATRFPFRTTLDEQINGASTAIRQHFPDARPYPAASDAATDTVMAHRTVEFIVTREGVRSYTRASVAQVGDWIIKVRYTIAAPDDAAARQAQATAGGIFAGALSEIIAPPNL